MVNIPYEGPSFTPKDYKTENWRLQNKIKELKAFIHSLECEGEWCGKSPIGDDKGLCSICAWKDIHQ